MRGAIRAHDWTTSLFGSPEVWPAPLRAALTLVLDSIGPTWLVWGPELTFLYNDAYVSMLGSKHPMALGRPMAEVWAEIWAEVQPLVARSLAGDPVQIVDLPLKVQRGAGVEQAYFTFSFAPLREEAGTIQGLFCAVVETTAGVSARQHLDALVRSSSEVRYALSADWSELYQLAGGNFIADNATANPNWLTEYIPLEDREAVRAEYDRAIKTRSTYQLEHRVNLVGGTVGWALSRAVPQLDAEGRITGWLGAASDITARKRAEADLHELNETLERQVAQRSADLDRVWRNAQDLQVVVDADGVFRAVSPSATRLLGWAPEEMVGRSLFAFTDPEGHAASRAALRQAAHESLPLHRNRYRHKDGGHRWIAWVTTPEDGLIFCYGRDVTLEIEQAQNLLQAEDALRQSQKLEAIGQLTGGVAHDFNNLLTVIKSSTDLLKRPNLPEERRIRYVDAISDTVDRAARLTAQLLAFARRQALKPEVFAACDGVRAINEMVGTLTGARIRLTTELPARRCYIDVDPSQFDTALVNMAVNARDAMSGEGAITIRVAPVEAIPAVRTHPTIKGPYVAVSLNDTGSGIPPERLDHIFEPFFTTKEVGKGTGLGLSQVLGFAKQSGGEVTVESEVGEGTTFTLYLPRVHGASRKPVKAEMPDVLIVGHDTRVLVVEDNADVGSFSVQALIELGYLPILAANAEEALTELTKDADGFDVVFSDVVMPGMNGVDLAIEIRRLYPDLPVILTSGYSHVLAREGTHGFELLQKPYSVEQLSRILNIAAQTQRSTNKPDTQFDV
ncbi:PAS domain-containing protein [Methylobacterium sp. HMF5984]|uniref:PAS domain-containing protein n=1 Tax=Methylobacterium sp. HMF5984 TaxID=3367370 RepID=UPI003854E25E